MKRISTALKRIWGDILAGRNLEAYVVTVIGIALVALGILGTVNIELSLTVIIAALALLVFKTTTPEKLSLDIDAVLQDREDFGPFRDTVRGRRQVWIYGPSSVNALKEEIEREVLDKGGEVRILLQDPDGPAIDLLRDQLDSRDPRANLKTDLDTSLRLLHHLLTTTANGKLQCRLLSYSPGFSMVIVDPDSRDGQIVVEFLGFRYQHVRERMHITLRRAETPRWFDHWLAQYQRMWEAGNPL